VPEDIVLENVSIELAPPADFRRSRIDERPPEPAEPSGSGEPWRAGQVRGVGEAPLAGFRIRQAHEVSLLRCSVRWIGERPAEAVAIDAAPGLQVRVENFREEVRMAQAK
jgi:hypothetical protein